MEIVSVPAIVAAVYGIIEVYKMIFKSETAKKAIPIVAGVLGTVLGVVAFFTCPDIVAADNAFFAAVIGLASGLGSVGINQVGKQLLKKNDDKGDK